MARIASVDLPKGKHILIALQYIYGIGPILSQRILTSTNVDPTKKVSDLSDEEVNRIREVIDRQYKVEGELKKQVQLNVRRLIEIGSYTGYRHSHSLPVRGQRTRTNARTKRGQRKTVAGRGKKRGTAKK